MDLVRVVIKAVIFLTGVLGMYFAYKLGAEHGYQEGIENGVEMGYTEGYSNAYERMRARNEVQLESIFKERRAVVSELESRLEIATEMLKRVDKDFKRDA